MIIKFYLPIVATNDQANDKVYLSEAPGWLKDILLQNLARGP